jgi:hypothetical protein
MIVIRYLKPNVENIFVVYGHSGTWKAYLIVILLFELAVLGKTKFCLWTKMQKKNME